MRLSMKILLTALLLLGPLGAFSAPTPVSEDPGIQLAQGGGMTLNQAVEQVRRQYGGRIVSAETRKRGGREVHVIKVLTADGKVKTVEVPGRSSGRG